MRSEKLNQQDLFMGWMLEGDEGKSGSRVSPRFWFGYCVYLVILLSEMGKSSEEFGK